MLLPMFLFWVKMNISKAIDDAGHGKASIFKVKGLECVDRAIGQLAKLLWQVDQCDNSITRFLTGDHSTPVEYGDHSFEPVPSAICWLKDFVSARGGACPQRNITQTPSLPTIKMAKTCPTISVCKTWEMREKPKLLLGTRVCKFNEIEAARGCFGRLPGGEMMGIVKSFLELDRWVASAISSNKVVKWWNREQ